MIRFFLITAFVSSIGVASVDAAALSLRASSQVTQEKVFSVDVVLATGGVAINSVDIAIAVSNPKVRFMGYQESGSLIKLWIRQPKMTNGVVYFSGSIPGGASGTTIGGGQDNTLSLVRLLFSAPTVEDIIFSIPQSTVLLHDGKGTALDHTRSSKTVSVAVSPPKKEEAPLVVFEDARIDSTPPEPIDVIFYQSSLFDRTPSMIHFSTVDFDSGIARYDIRIKGRLYSNAQSPFVVPKKFFPYKVDIIAYDIAGNTTSAFVQIPGIWSLFSVLVFVVLGIAGFWLRTMVKNKI